MILFPRDNQRIHMECVRPDEEVYFSKEGLNWNYDAIFALICLDGDG